MVNILGIGPLPLLLSTFLQYFLESTTLPNDRNIYVSFPKHPWIFIKWKMGQWFWKYLVSFCCLWKWNFSYPQHEGALRGPTMTTFCHVFFLPRLFSPWEWTGKKATPRTIWQAHKKKLLEDGYLKVVLGLKELQTPLDLEDDHPRMSHKFEKKNHSWAINIGHLEGVPQADP